VLRYEKLLGNQHVRNQLSFISIFVDMTIYTESTDSGQGIWIGKGSYVKAETSDGTETFEGRVVAAPVSVDDVKNGSGPSSYIVHDLDLDQNRIVMPGKIWLLSSDEEALLKSKHRDKYPVYFKNSK